MLEWHTYIQYFARPFPVQVLNEQYEELVFSEPVQSFFNRVTNYQPGQVHMPSTLAFAPAHVSDYRMTPS